MKPCQPSRRELATCHVETALRLRSGESDRAIAEHVGVSHPFVAGIRSELVTVTSSPPRTGRDGKTRSTKPERQAKGGKASAAARSEHKPPKPRGFALPLDRDYHACMTTHRNRIAESLRHLATAIVEAAQALESAAPAVRSKPAAKSAAKVKKNGAPKASAHEEAMISLLRKKGPLRSEQIQKALRFPPEVVRALLVKLLDSRKVRSRGRARGTTYRAMA